MGEASRLANILLDQAKELRASGLAEEADQKLAEAADVLWPGKEAGRATLSSSGRDGLSLSLKTHNEEGL